MRRYIYISLILIILLVGCTSGEEVTTFVASENLDEMVIPAIEMEEPELPMPLNSSLAIYGESPIFEEGLEDAWDLTIVFPGAVIYHGGLYHMFYNGLTFNRGITGGGIGYAVSANGVEWFRMADTPILTWDDTIGENDWLRASSATIEDDNTWVLYLSSVPRNIIEEFPRIWRATAPAPNGPWTFDDIPLLEPGETGEWDYYGVEDPVVLKTDAGYLMYYLNSRFDNRRGLTGIGLATSADGVSWIKYDDPGTAERFSMSDPIFLYEGDTAGYDAIQAYFVWQDSQGFSMLYGTGRNTTNDMLYMTSLDGIVWNAPFEEPVFSTDDVAFLGNFFAPKVVFVDGQYLVYLYGSDGAQSFGDIYLATVAQ